MSETERTNPVYLVLASGRGGRATVRRAVQSWPSLEPGESAIRVALEIPARIFSPPTHLVQIPAEAQSIVAEAVEIEAPEAEEPS